MGLAQNLKGLNGGAEPRLTSGGEAGVNESNFQDRLLNFKTVSHIGRRSRSDQVSRSLDLARIQICSDQLTLHLAEARSQLTNSLEQLLR